MGAPGCDDAPVVRVPVGGDAKPVTFVYPYYENPRFFSKQIGNWESYPHELQEHLSVIVVDDGSPENPAEHVPVRQSHTYDFRIFRLDVDVRWNWLAARNIGAHHAPDGWILLTDMDHVVPAETLAALVHGRHDPGTIYRFSRVEHTGASIHPHPNSWFMTRAMFWKTGGYDEALSGHYGTDGDYRRRCAATAPIRILTDVLVRHEFVGDSSTQRYKRKQPEDAGKKRIVAQRRPGWRPKVLSFPYHEVAL